MSRDVVILADPDLMAAAAAARLITALVDAQVARGHAHVVLTGGTSGGAVQEAVAAAAARDAVDWAAVDVWWGDERYLPAGDPDRNETQARGFLLDALPLDPARVHPMPASDGAFGADVDAAAASYAAQLAIAAGRPDGVPLFDVLMLGVGPDGHVASLFPEHPQSAVREGTAIAVRDSPKPPSTRISLTLPALQSARQTWLLATGQGKADVVAQAIGGKGLPCGSVHGTERTLWLLDHAAASKL
ncbi:MAG TPA: 6-phosphogluconolactonase [Kineosporiaceae bacterium]|nr:6-phosphogluconolactonase [Kineosporiaceae bacterium]